MKLKVYGCGWMGHSRRIVATTSQKEAAKLIGVSLSEFRNYGCETGNEEEIKVAMEKPGTAFERKRWSAKEPWKEAQ